jgi:hypothetical protein
MSMTPAGPSWFFADSVMFGFEEWDLVQDADMLLGLYKALFFICVWV